eukprot:CAMPEP_0202353046 /NCGR_PEP_ID=MMETSP1126-20121109/8980_1 /ASSEMBLY_ACC=CAM_ASM_000457 /TAXON_ID=3047 /ORGANISM="Dunaliella tertiolecta, Strain CCMP1320" /LENGTH=54 /DNA_ID=CAMNT_0048945349 /DNA_START=286 /DNA_END=450 /DNA_ORIENTATION=+
MDANAKQELGSGNLTQRKADTNQDAGRTDHEKFICYTNLFHVMVRRYLQKAQAA